MVLLRVSHWCQASLPAFVHLDEESPGAFVAWVEGYPWDCRMSDQQQVVQLEDIYGDLEFGMSLETDNTQVRHDERRATLTARHATLGTSWEED